jgi:hypothetical protein
MPCAACVQDLTFRHYIMRLKVSSETYQDEQKIRTGIQSVAAPNFVQESKVRCAAAGQGRAGQQELTALVVHPCWS